MPRVLQFTSIAVLLFVLGTGTGTLSSSAGESPDKVTTDTLSYCRQLSARVDAMENASSSTPQEVYDLSVAGKDMCNHGAIRGGIMRLRSAIVLMLHPGATPAMQMGRTN
jgi:hypothetical protein